MTRLTLKRGQAANITFAVVDRVSGAPLDIAALAVTIAIDGNGRHLERVGVVNAPSSLGTGHFAIVPADYDVLKPGTYRFQVWAAATDVPFDDDGTIEVVDVPQVLS